MVIFSWLVETSRLNMGTLVLRTFSLFRTYTFIYLDKWLSNFQLILYLDTNEWIGLKKKKKKKKIPMNDVVFPLLTIMVEFLRLSIPYHTGRYGRNIPYRPAIWYVRPPVSYRKKYRPYRPRINRTGQFQAIPVGTEKSFFFFFNFVIFEFLLG